jgi:hypothetical protein
LLCGELVVTWFGRRQLRILDFPGSRQQGRDRMVKGAAPNQR